MGIEKTVKDAIVGAVDKSVVGKLGSKGVLFKNVEETVINPLGKRLQPWIGGAAVVGTAAWGVGAGITTYKNDRLRSNAEYTGNLASMDYDGSPNVDRITGRRDFSATGDLVFGLNNSRHS